VWRGSAYVEVRQFGSIQGSHGHRERGIFTKHRAIDRFSARRYRRASAKRWFEIPIRCDTCTRPLARA
jgi:hypothetical protein